MHLWIGWKGNLNHYQFTSAATEKSHIVAAAAASPAESVVEAAPLERKTENFDRASVLRAVAAMSQISPAPVEKVSVFLPR
jgi:hypothetical protein